MRAQHPARSSIRDAALACLIAFGMSLIWCLRGWHDLAAMRLPDTDDVVRLQQIRDWLAGQRFGDLTQYRLGPPEGLAMHWSRLGDLVPAAIIRLSAPLVGNHAAELLAVTIWPALSFAAALYLVGQIARRLDPDRSAVTALIVAALAFPTTTLFAPGRIDHHAAQIVLLLATALLALGPASLARGLVTGLLLATSLAIGLETAPLLAVIGAAAAFEWIATKPRAADRLAGLGAGLFCGLAVACLTLAGGGWSYPACDALTAQAAEAAAILSLTPLALAFVGRTLRTSGSRTIAALVIGGVALAAALGRSPGCIAPYGNVDPLITRLWLSQVEEAQGLLHAAPASAIGYLGLLLAGLGATAMHARRAPRSGWTIMLALQAASLAIAFVQLRGAYAGAILAAPALAAVIGAARARGSGRLIAAWLASAGIVYPLAATALPQPTGDATPSAAGCAPRTLTDELAALPAGMVFAPIDVGAWGVASTPHHFAAAPYHRNDRGNLAMYRFFLQSPQAAHRIATRWHVDYVIACRSGLLAMRGAPGSMAQRLATGTAPGWLHPLPARSREALLFRVAEPRSSRKPLSLGALAH